MPPVMGAVAFLMADFLQIPDAEVAIAAIISSLIYDLALFVLYRPSENLLTLQRRR